MKKKTQEKRFVVRKYILAKTVEEALKKEKKFPADDVFVDSDWIKENPNKLGF